MVSIVLIALMSLSLFPAATFASHTPSSADDSLYEEFGPRASQMLIKVYTDYISELAGFINKEVDIMDLGLEPIDYQYFETNDPAHEQYATAFYNEFGLYEYDINNQVLPTSIISVRQAFSHMIDKDHFINTYMAGAGIKADSPIASIPGWYNPAITDLYNLAPRTTWPIPDDTADWQAAINLLIADLGPPITDPENPMYLTWTWPSPFPDPDPSGEYPPVADGHLLVHARSEDPARSQQGTYFDEACEIALPAMGVALGFGPVRLKVDLYIVPRSVTSQQVMGYYRYHLYTGNWSLGRDPELLLLYTTALIAKPAGYGNNYVMYSNPAYDAEVDAMIHGDIGVPTNPCDALYHAYLAQQILMGDAGIIPFWTFSGYKAYLSNWRGVVNQVGFGANSWWTFLNAHKVGSKGGDIIRYGWAGDSLSLNVMSAQGLWDWEALGKVYEGLITVNPYDMTDDRPLLAKSWEVGTWMYEGTTLASKVTFHLREDVWWQDMPALERSAITFDGGDWLDARALNRPLTVVDLAFTIEYIRDLLDSQNGWRGVPVDHVGVNMDIWGDMWKSPVSGQSYTVVKPEWYTADVDYGIPWQLNYLQHEGALDGESITIYMNEYMPWMALHMLGGVSEVPYHIWRYIPQNVGLNVDAWLYDIVYGSGPWILLDRQPGIQMTMVPYQAGQSYRGITSEKSYWYGPIRPPEAENDQETISLATGEVTFSNELRNYIATDDLTVGVMFEYDIKVYDALDNLVYSAAGVTLPAFYVIPNGVTQTVSAVVATIPLALLNNPPGLTGASRIYISDGMYWFITDDTNGPVPWVGRTGTYGDYIWNFATGLSEFYVSDYWYWPRVDITRNGIVDIADATQIGLNWQHTVPPAPRNVDINQDGRISIPDATQIGLNWQLVVPFWYFRSY